MVRGNGWSIRGGDLEGAILGSVEARWGRALFLRLCGGVAGVGHGRSGLQTRVVEEWKSGHDSSGR